MEKDDWKLIGICGIYCGDCPSYLAHQTNDIGELEARAQKMGFTIEETEDDGKPYWLLKGGDKLKAGMLTNPVEGYRSTWIPYNRVGSVAKMSERIKRMGGKVILEPNADVRGGRVAVATDPMGGPFAIQEWDN